MKFAFAFFFAQFTMVNSVKVVSGNSEIKGNSALGMKLLSQARKLEQDGEDEVTWVVGYSLKFQGCHLVQQWNNDADEDDELRIEKKRLIRFRLCPTDSCTVSDAAGCGDGYGDYVLDLNTYIQAYYEMAEKQIEYDCEYYLNNQCDCNDDDGKGDDFDRDDCEYNCFYNAGKEQCIDEDQENFDVEKYLACGQLELENENRKLEENEEEEIQYYVGPYCAEQGGGVFLGVFNEDSCSQFADDYEGKTTFEELTGESLPYSSESLVGMECFSCQEINNNEDNEDNEDNEQVWEECEAIYNSAGKCESNLAEGIMENPNSNACAYIEGVKITRSDGVVFSTEPRTNPVVTSFIVIFAMAFAAMCFYVYYLRTRLGVKKDTLM
mmetsp:Transcript_33908/g.38575  ORF Transcript_33908/g.38575 Transcript_33908/m.38575 type:complete len:381 (+) Transcript_33908:86-1228(+)